MTVRPPRAYGSAASRDTPLDALQLEIRREQASTLGRVAARLEDALAALAAHDADPAGAGDRTTLREAAADALWQLVVQREACGLGTSEQLMRDYRVPRDLAAAYAMPLSRWRRRG